ncbi:hypothetical protein AAC03nite_25930 [Alicyclobacillus acidoterrestris]|nr:hypothetical protein AAC03nite_25930 [Alicyclobacillus acidoterrestris]
MAVGALVLSAHSFISQSHLQTFIEVALGWSIAAAVLAVVISRRFLRVALAYLCLLGAALALGWLHSADVAPRPTVIVGAPTVIRGTVTSAAVYGSETLYQINVRHEGTGTGQRRCDYTVSWRPTSHAVQPLFVGEGAVLSGMFVEADGATAANTARAIDLLSPLYTFRGQLFSVQPARGALADLQWLSGALNRTVPSADAAFANVALSMVVGRAAAVPTATQTLFLDAGVMHLLAASGANVVLVLRVSGWVWKGVVRLLRIQVKMLSILYQLAVIWGFVWLCGGAIPIVRAGVFASYTVLARACGRRVHPFTALSVSTFLFALWSPEEISTVSGILSTMAAFAIFQATQLLPGHCPRRSAQRVRPRWFVSLVRSACSHGGTLMLVSLLIDAYMIPLIWWLFGQLTPYGAVATVVVEPLLLLLLPLTLLWCGVVVVSQCLPLSQAFADVGHGVGLTDVGLVRVLCFALQKFVALPHSFDVMPQLSTGWLLSYYGLLLLCQRPTGILRVLVRLIARMNAHQIV